ncbi:MAG: hypothetical protein HY828_00955 [Actinobacteria bacterium]|nr:hypothetical protein [Actinomycetota bacterium]
MSAVSAHALGLREYVSTKTGTEVALWSVAFGAPVGTMVYTARVDGHAGLAAMTASLAGDATYEAMIAKGADLVAGPPSDMMRESLDGSDPGGSPPVGSVAVITTAIIANGKYAEAIGWGLDVAAHATKVGGVPVAFYMDMYGPFGQVTWIGVGADMAAADASNAKLNTDADYINKLSAAGDLFVPGMANRSMALRIG